MLEQTERQVRERIAEGQRAAENRVGAAEQEAKELLDAARAEAARIRDQARAESASAVNEATGEALAIVARAQENADSVLSEARADAAREKEASEERARELLRGARSAASEVQNEGLELVGNLREMGDSLRTNAERLLRDVQAIHSQMLSQIAQFDTAFGIVSRAGSSASARRVKDLTDDGEVLDVPEFMPPP
jgi:vacuolar-type H+-ATPase subunit H